MAKAIKNLFITWLFIGTVLYAQSTDIRGQVISYDTYYRNYVPVANIVIELYQYNRFINRTYTDSYGMYYFFYIPPGPYTLRLNQRNYTIHVYPIDRRYRQFQDISKILLN